MSTKFYCPLISHTQRGHSQCCTRGLDVWLLLQWHWGHHWVARGSKEKERAATILSRKRPRGLLSSNIDTSCHEAVTRTASSWQLVLLRIKTLWPPGPRARQSSQFLPPEPPSPARIVAHIPRILTFYRNLNTRNEVCDKTSYDGAPARCKVRSAPRHLGHFLNGPMLIMMDPGSGCY